MDSNTSEVLRIFRRLSQVVALAISLLFSGQLALSITTDLQSQIAIELNDSESEPEEEKDDKEEEKFKQSTFGTNMLSEALKSGNRTIQFDMILVENHHPENHTPPPEI